MIRKHWGRVVLAGLLTGASSIWIAAPAWAATLVVNTTADEYGTGADCSLREAIQSVYSGSSFGGCPLGAAGDTIVLGEGTYLLSLTGPSEDLNATGDLDLRVDMTIQGQGPQTIIQGMGDRVIQIHQGSPSIIRDLTITGGTGTEGGGIYSATEIELRLQRVIVTGNNAGGFGGGGLSFQGGTEYRSYHHISIEDSVISSNDASEGGGISNKGYSDMEIHGSLIFDNQSSNAADGIVNFARLIVRDSTIAGNGFGTVGSDVGGGLYTNDDSTLENVTFAMNEAGASSGTGGHIYAAGGNLVVRNVLMDASVSGECGNFGTLSGYTAEGTNMVELPGTCQSFTASGSMDLGVLDDYGGPTRTVSIGAGSAARGVAGGAFCGITDQRGVPRPNGACDVGSYQYEECGGVPVNVVGTQGKDTQVGNPLDPDESFLMLGGNDVVRAAAGMDKVCGGSGKDRLSGGSGKDFLDGGAADDFCNGGAGRDKSKACERVRSIP